MNNIIGISKDSGKTLTNNEIKVTIKIISSLENTGILLKGTTQKITSREWGFLNFFRPLTTASLPSTKSVPTLLPNVLPLGLMAAASTTDAANQTTIFALGMTALIISSKGMKDIMKIAKSLEEFSLH